MFAEVNHTHRMNQQWTLYFQRVVTLAVSAVWVGVASASTNDWVTGDGPNHYVPIVNRPDLLQSGGKPIVESGDMTKDSALLHGLHDESGLLSQRTGVPVRHLETTHEQTRASTARISALSNAVNIVSLKQDCHGRWEWLSDGTPVRMNQGGNYQPVPDGKSIVDFIQNHQLDRLMAALLPDDQAKKISPSLTGQGQGAKFMDDGITALRLYQAPLEDPGEISRFKQVMEKAYELYGLRVNLGDFLGLYDQIHSGDKAWIADRVRTIGRLYGSEPWVAALTLGNENEYYLGSGGYPSLPFSPSDYYSFMDQLAGILKKDSHVQRPILLGSGRPNGSAWQNLAALQNVDGLGLNLYGDASVLGQDLANLQNLNNTRKANGLAVMPFVLNEFGQTPDWLLTLTDETRSQALNQQMNLLDSSPLVAGRFIFELTNEAWKRVDEGPGADRLGIVGSPTVESQIAAHKQPPITACIPSGIPRNPPANRYPEPDRGLPGLGR